MVSRCTAMSCWTWCSLSSPTGSNSISLSGKEPDKDVEIVFTGLREGEKLYEELLIDDSDMHTEYDSITVAAPTQYSIDRLNEDIESLLQTTDKLMQLK
ncbi:MAG: hypothetical protein DSZ00_02250, partial [Gammaproteobacteria bacterium]